MRQLQQQQEVQLPYVYNNCQYTATAAAYRAGTGPGVAPGRADGCYEDGEATLAVRRELASGAVLVSMPGYTVAYSTLDNNRNPTSHPLASKNDRGSARRAAETRSPGLAAGTTLTVYCDMTTEGMRGM